MLIIKSNDIIKYWLENKNTILIAPSNKGYKKDGSNVCGAGINKEIAKILPFVPKLLGEYIKAEIRYNNEKDIELNIIPSKIHYPTRLFFFFTKDLNIEKPHLSWQNNSDLKTVERSLIELEREVNCSFNNKYTFLLPKVGCGNGGLNYKDVKPLIEYYVGTYSNIILFE